MPERVLHGNRLNGLSRDERPVLERDKSTLIRAGPLRKHQHTREAGGWVAALIDGLPFCFFNMRGSGCLEVTLTLKLVRLEIDTGVLLFPRV